MKVALATLVSVLVLTLAMAATALAAPKGNQANCPNGAPAFNEHRSATGQANACGPKA